ncbi:glycosyltransferase family 1 protein [Pseudomonas capeferrum]|uniref:glycosyltransferase family 1 protein n=1 Tax=Pseudomonas capeferrum TaxID=1495066 RepID=UPI0015E40A28|nr:glycosyltransferase family 1 protein [Pseudomonas capeferrum]MBA1205105.1 glycosyltransferase family 1 protein [Pseudomonas capeferrum]
MNQIEQPVQLSPTESLQPQTRIAGQRPTLLCLSHLRWGFVYQRPQHVMSRLARDYDVLFFEEPVFEQVPSAHLRSHAVAQGVTVLVPVLPEGSGEKASEIQRALLDEHLRGRGEQALLLWYYTPMSLSFSDHLEGQVVIYDCMDELSAFLHAPAALVDMEKRLLKKANVVFTGGRTLGEAKRKHHENVHAMPSSVDIDHFAAARDSLPEPPDQASIARPRLGFFGVIDERFDVELVRDVATQRPDWQIVLVGPVVKIDPATLPRLPNIHYLGSKRYEELPAYLAGWDVALMPFALNESTRFISPTKTPEYLAGGCPVVSTRISDVVNDYGRSGVVSIADDTAGFIAAIEAFLALRAQPGIVCERADKALQGMSWNKTCHLMKEQIECQR